MEKTGKKIEEEILASFERDEWQSVRSPGKEISRYREYAGATLAKDRRVNIRLSSRDLEDLQVRAAEEGMPYQTLMASVLHKYVTGRLVEDKLLAASDEAAVSAKSPQRRARAQATQQTGK